VSVRLEKATWMQQLTVTKKPLLSALASMERILKRLLSNWSSMLTL
jgi:hypothetical protein